MGLEDLISAFFTSLSRWDWRTPVMLLGSAGTPAALVSEEVLAGCPILVQLPIAGATLSATPEVSESTMRTTQQELLRAAKLAAAAKAGRGAWDEIYSEHRFFQRYQHYIQLDFLASSQELLQTWMAWGRHQMKDFVQIYDSTLGDQVSLRPWPEILEFKHASWPFARAIFVGLLLEPEDPATKQTGQRRTIDLREAMPKFIEKLVTWPEAHDNAKQFELIIRHVRSSMLRPWRENQQKGLLAQHPVSMAAEEAKQDSSALSPNPELQNESGCPNIA